MVAWAQLSGLTHLRPHIRALLDRGGVADTIVGIDQGIATVDGLKAAMEIFEPAFIFYDRGRRTYHPKLYVLEGRRSATVIVGSANITEGGLFAGYEAAAAIELDKRLTTDRAFLSDVNRYFDLLRKRAACRKLDRLLLARFQKDPHLTKSRRRQAAEQRQARSFQQAAAGLFGSAGKGLANAPKRPPSPTTTAGAKPRRREGLRRKAVRSRRGRGKVLASWWKLLTPSDVMRKPPGSHERGFVVLSRANHPINQNTFFRNELFGRVRWARQRMRTVGGRKGKSKEVAQIPFDVVVNGRQEGRFVMTIDHAMHRVANQANSPTWLNWSTLKNVINKNDFRGHYLSIEKISGGRFRLILTGRKPGLPVVPA